MTLYETEPPSPPTGQENKLDPQDRAAHRWYRFVLSFPPHLVRSYLQRFALSSSDRVLDPFCGTGTTLVECQKLGIESVGMEANPVAHFASRVKVDWSLDPDGLLVHAEQVAAAVQAELEHCPRRTLSETRHALLLKNSISPLPLHKTLVLIEQLRQAYNAQYHDHELLALMRVLVPVSNLQFGPEVGVGAVKQDAPVVELWLSMVRAIAEDLRRLRSPDGSMLTDRHQHLAPQGKRAVVHLGDSRNCLALIGPGTVDTVITSPPYPNEKDYSRTTRLESVLLGFIDDKAGLQTCKRQLLRSNTRGVYKDDDDDQWIVGDPEIQRLAAEISARCLELGKTSGFERLYARVTKLYFGGMARHLANLRPVLRPGAHLAYVVGDQASYLRVMIRTGQILANIAQSLGYELVSIDLFRTRLATATKEQLREEVVVLRWPG